MKHEITLPEGLVPETSDLVCAFAEAIGEKLYKAQLKYGYTDGWASNEWEEEARKQLMLHIDKGDPLDVANYCAFLWYMGAPTCVKGNTKKDNFDRLKSQYTSLVEKQDKIIEDNKVLISARKGNM